MIKLNHLRISIGKGFSFAVSNLTPTFFRQAHIVLLHKTALPYHRWETFQATSLPLYLDPISQPTIYLLVNKK